MHQRLTSSYLLLFAQRRHHRICQQDHGLENSNQQSALSTQHSAISNQHSANPPQNLTAGPGRKRTSVNCGDALNAASRSLELRRGTQEARFWLAGVVARLDLRQLVRPPALRAQVQDGQTMALVQIDVRAPGKKQRGARCPDLRARPGRP